MPARVALAVNMGYRKDRNKKRQQLRDGELDDEIVEIRQGLEPGERIVVRGLETLTDGTRVFGQVTDCEVDDVKIGMEVRLEFLRLQTEDHHGVLSYAHKFVPKWW